MWEALRQVFWEVQLLLLATKLVGAQQCKQVENLRQPGGLGLWGAGEVVVCMTSCSLDVGQELDYMTGQLVLGAQGSQELQ